MLCCCLAPATWVGCMWWARLLTRDVCGCPCLQATQGIPGDGAYTIDNNGTLPPAEVSWLLLRLLLRLLLWRRCKLWPL